MTSHEELLKIQQGKLLKALAHLEYSYKKVQRLSEQLNELDEEGLETWESFAARFSRVAEIFLARYLRTAVLRHDPGFSGTLRDFVNQGEKLGLIDDADAWMSIRELRNLTAHEYSEKDLPLFLKQLKDECPRLLKIKTLISL